MTGDDSVVSTGADSELCVGADSVVSAGADLALFACDDSVVVDSVLSPLPLAASPVCASDPACVLVRGAWVGACNCDVLVPALCGSVVRVRVPRTEPVVLLRPGKAVAAAAVNAAVSAALPASSQRLARLSRRSAASRVRVVWRLSKA